MDHKKTINALLSLDSHTLSIISSTTGDGVLRFLCDLTMSLRKEDYDSAGWLLDIAVVATEEKKEIKRAFNEGFLYEKDLEWAKSGILRTFRFWSKEEKSQYLFAANQIATDLQTSGFDACLGFGSALSFVRDRDFIPHDDDLDVIVALQSRVRNFRSALGEIERCLRSHGYGISGDYISHRHVHRTECPRVVDVFVGVQEGEYITWFPGPRKSIERETVFPALTCNFMGQQTLFPRNPFTYLELIYGPDWFEPQPLWNHVWDISTVGDLLG